MTDFKIQPSEIETNLVPLDLAVSEETQGFEIGNIPSTNSANTVPTNSNIIPSGGGSIVKGFLKTQNFNAGSSGWSIDADGSVEFNDGNFRGDITGASGTFTGTITASAGTIGGWTIGATFIGDNATAANANVLIDSANDLIRLGPTSGLYITLDGANKRIRSSDYSAGVAGFTVEPTLIEAENLVARGIMKGATFAYDIISAVGGQLMVTNADTLDTDMTAADNSTLTIKGTTAFAVNDILVMRATTASGIQEEWFRVTSITSAPTYSVTRDLAGSFSANSNPIWKAGTPVVKQGSSDGASTYSGGWLRLIGEGTNSPYYSVFARTGVAYNAYTEVVRMGNLNGFLDYASALYGFAAGDSDDYFSYDPTNGVRINTPVNVDISLTAGQAITAGQTCGIWGYVTDDDDTYHNADAGTYVDAANADTNYDGTALMQCRASTSKRGIVHFNGLPAQPSETGLTILKWYIKFKCNYPNDQGYLEAGDLNASFNETTVTWNTKPSGQVTGIALFPPGTGTGVRETDWTEVTETQYNNIRDHGMYLVDEANFASVYDEDNATQPPACKAKFIYEIQNGKAWLASGLATKYANGFLGIAQDTVVAEAAIKVRTEGKDSHQTGLTPYSDYELSNTPGAIQTGTSATSDKVIGRALSATMLQVKYVLGDAT